MWEKCEMFRNETLANPMNIAGDTSRSFWRGVFTQLQFIKLYLKNSVCLDERPNSIFFAHQVARQSGCTGERLTFKSRRVHHYFIRHSKPLICQDGVGEDPSSNTTKKYCKTTTGNEKLKKNIFTRQLSTKESFANFSLTVPFKSFA